MVSAPNPESDPKVADAYFRSISDSFHYTFKNQETIWYPVKIANALTTLGPLLVIVPFALADLLAKLNIRFFAPRSLRILGMTIHTTPEGVWAALLITVLVVGIAAVFALNKRRTRKLCANFLSKSQMRFGYCLAMREELRTYQATRVPKHIENALDFWFRLLFSLEAFFAPESKQQFRPPKKGKGLAQAEKSSPKVLPPNLERLRQSFSWFRLEPQSERIVESLNLFPERVQYRVKEKKDLTAVGELLSALGDYLYSMMPEVSPQSDSENVALLDWGLTRLQGFSEKILLLPAYGLESQTTAERGTFKRSIKAGIAKFSGLFSHQNILLCFISWLLISAAAVIVALLTTLHYFPGIKIDSTLVALVISAPLLASVTLVAVSRKGT